MYLVLCVPVRISVSAHNYYLPIKSHGCLDDVACFCTCNGYKMFPNRLHSVSRRRTGFWGLSMSPVSPAPVPLNPKMLMLEVPAKGIACTSTTIHLNGGSQRSPRGQKGKVTENHETVFGNYPDSLMRVFLDLTKLENLRVPIFLPILSLALCSYHLGWRNKQVGLWVVDTFVNDGGWTREAPTRLRVVEFLIHHPCSRSHQIINWFLVSVAPCRGGIFDIHMYKGTYICTCICKCLYP